jgi:hypothetical protein
MSPVTWALGRVGALPLALAGALLAGEGCNPDLKIADAQSSRLHPPPYEGIDCRFEVENAGWSDSFLSADARGPIVVRGVLSSDGSHEDGPAAASVVLVPSGGALREGESKAGGFQAPLPFDPWHPYLLVSVATASTQQDSDLSNNSRAAVIEPVSPAALPVWLAAHPAVATNLIWEQPGGSVVAYSAWDSALRQALQRHVTNLLAGTPLTLADPPPLAVVPSGLAETTFAVSTAQELFLAHVARSIVSEEELPWKVAELDNTEVAHLFDSRGLFRWNASRGAYYRDWAEFGRVTPGDPNTVFDYMQTNGLVGSTRIDTIHRLLDWSRGLTHYLLDDSAANYVNHWQYAGEPPVSRVIAGTTRTSDGLRRRWTAGCAGTSGLLWLMLRTVNIPAEFSMVSGHALPHFMHEDLYLSHGDDPYNCNIASAPWTPIQQLPIPGATYESWFGASMTWDQRLANVGRRACEVAAEYLSGCLVSDHCDDVRIGRAHTVSKVYADLKQCHTVPELESMNLWTRLDAKAEELGSCSP